MGIILFILVIFLSVYAPVIQKDFFYKNDYAMLGTDGIPSTLMNNNLNEGRILNGFLQAYMSSNIRTTNSTKTVRLGGIIGMVLFAFVIWAIFKQFRLRSDHAFLMSILICTLPCSQIYVLTILSIPYVYSSLLSSLSALIIFSVIFKKESKERVYEIIGILTTIILLVASLNINQSAAMMYWAFGVIFILTTNNNDILKKYHRPLFEYFFTGLVSLVIYYLVFIKILPSVMNRSIERGKLLTFYQLPVKLIKFIIIALNNAINLWNFEPNYIVTIFSGLIILSGFIFSSFAESKEKNQLLAINSRQKRFLILCLLILSYLPSLIIAENAYTYRTLIAFGSALVILFYFGLINIVEFVPKISPNSRKTLITVLLTVLAVVAALMARYHAVHWQSPIQPDIYIWEKWHIG
jgi:hypothetical protein